MTNLLALFANESQELNVQLDVITKNLLIVTLGVNFAHTGPMRMTFQPFAPKDMRHRGVGHLNVMGALQMPNDPHCAEMVFKTKIAQLFNALGRCPIGVPFGDRWRVDQPSFTTLCEGLGAIGKR